jgi:hypothetical protein
MPGKRDTVVVNDNGNKTTYQKRILLYTIREAYELFLAENTGKLFFYRLLILQFYLRRFCGPHGIC